MPITVLSDVILSNAVLSAGVRGKNNRLNNRVGTENGFQSINIVWSQSLREYELGTVPLRIDDWQEIEALHEITEGGAYGFLMEDPKDNTVTAGSVAFISEAGGYQLQKRYIDTRSSRYKDRPITRPRASGFVLKLDGVAVDAGDYTLDEDTGRLTIPALPDAASLTWDGRFYVPVHFKDDFIDWDMVVAGSMDQRFLAGPSVVLIEVREYVATASGLGTSADTPGDHGDDAPTPTPAPSTPGIPAPTPTPTPIPPPEGDVFPTGVAGSWLLTFRDEFLDDDLDSSKWNDEIWYGDNSVSHTTQNYDLTAGALRIWPYKHSGTNQFMNRTIDTDGKFYQTFGFFEARMKLNTGRGVWPAFWLFNHDGAARPEVDIMEAYPGGGTSSGWGDASLHPNNYGLTVWNTAGASAGFFKLSAYHAALDLSADYHIYGCKWKSDHTIQFYFDGAPIGPVIPFTSTQRMYIMLDLWFGSASGTPDGTTPLGTSNAFLIDYVRAWQAA